VSRIFISYNQAHTDFAAVLNIQIEKAGIDTWMDKGRLRLGQDWSGEIDQAISCGHSMVQQQLPHRSVTCWRRTR
jgi:TIR domain